MQPIGLLMREHRLIERMIKVIETEFKTSKESHKINTEFITIIIDFFKTYADEIHHGKEEDILFDSIKKIQISEEHKKTIIQLVWDHKKSREIIKTLDTTNQQYIQGDQSVLNEIQDKLHKLITLYPQHIKIEDKHFFFPIMEYFTRKECDLKLQEFYNFDKNIIHNHYSAIVEKQEKRYS